MTDLKTLIENYIAGELTDEQARELSQCLIDSPIARRAAWEHAHQEALLRQLVEESCGELRSTRLKPEVSETGSSVGAPIQGTYARATGVDGWRRLRWLSTAAVVLLLTMVASAAVFPPIRRLIVQGWQAVVVRFQGNGHSNVAHDDVDEESTDRPKPPAVAEQTTKEKNSQPAKPALKPQLKDEQKISHWEWDKFRWQAVDAGLVRPVVTSVVVPPGHKFVTVAVDDANGVRVRNLLDAVEVTKLGGNPDAKEAQVLSVEWNGLDDDGRPALDGTYRIRGCSHAGMKLVYEYSFLNPGTPPWEHYPNSGWGGDHGYPHAIACLRNHGNGPWRVAIGGAVGEGGTASFVIDADHCKCKALNNGWNGSKALAAADGMLWICESGSKYLYRVTYHDSKQIAFNAASGSTPTIKFDTDPWGIAVGKKKAAVLLHDEKQPKKERVVVFDKDSGENRVEVPLAVPARRSGLAFAADGTTLLASTDDGMLSIPTSEAKPSPKPVQFEGVEKPGPLATDNDGNLFILDRGADYQVKVFTPDGKLLRTVGAKGGQGDRLDFDREAFHGIEAISVDDSGNLWVTEQGETDSKPGVGFVRRIAVWDANGKFVKDFVGTTWYAANNTCLHQQDPTLAFGYGMIYKLEPGSKPGYRPLRYVTTPQPADAPFWLWTGSPGTLFGSARLFRSDVSGTMREYLLQANGFPILFQANEKHEYRPIIAIGSHEHNKAFPKVMDEPKALFLWSDLSGDGKPQPGEFQRLPGSTYKADLGWGYPPSRDLEWYVEGIELKPVKFTDAGVPLYDVESARRLLIPQHYLPVGNHLVAGLGGTFNSPRDGVYANGHHLFTDREGKPTAKYRCNWGHVHASWSSTPGYTPGQTGRSIGELHFAGVIDSKSDIGHVVAIQGNYGQSFVWSEDGLFVTPLFKDSRQNPQGWGAKEVFGADWTDVSMYGECFGGMVCRQDDGKVRYLFGRCACHVVRVEGLESVKRFDAGTVDLKGPTATGKPAPKADAADRVLRVPDVTGRHPPFKIDGDPTEWKGIPRHEIKVGDEVVAKVALAHTRTHLWLLAEVEDPSPWKNAGTDPKLAFKTGDAIELSLGSDRDARGLGHLTHVPKGEHPTPQPDRTTPELGDIRILIAPGVKGKVPTAIAYRPVKPEAKPEESMKFESPGKLHTFASVAPIPDVLVAVMETKTGYVIEVRLHCDRIDLRDATNGLRLRGDIGLLWGNEAGLVTERRAYLFNHSPVASIVSDTPSEAELYPAEWGVWFFE
jgi:sugar lactone lactonase YvrE